MDSRKPHRRSLRNHPTRRLNKADRRPPPNPGAAAPNAGTHRTTESIGGDPRHPKPLPIADAARTLPHALRRVGNDEEALSALGVLAGYDADLAAEATRLTNRLHDALLHVHPALERLLGKLFRRPGVLQLLAAAGTPEQLRALGPDGIADVVAARSPRTAQTLAAQVISALDQQSVVIPATAQFGLVIQGLAGQLLAVLDQRAQLKQQLEELLASHPLATILTTMPGVGPRTAIALLLAVGDGTTFRTAGHLAAYAGLAPVTRQSGRSIRGEHQPRRGNRQLRSLLYLSAFASLKDPTNRCYYDRKRAEGRSHSAALLCLARRRNRRLVRDDPRPPGLPEADRRRPAHNVEDQAARCDSGLTNTIGTPLCQGAVRECPRKGVTGPDTPSRLAWRGRTSSDRDDRAHGGSD